MVVCLHYGYLYGSPEDFKIFLVGVRVICVGVRVTHDVTLRIALQCIALSALSFLQEDFKGVKHDTADFIR